MIISGPGAIEELGHVRCYSGFNDSFRDQFHTLAVRLVVVVYREVEPIRSVKLEVDETWAEIRISLTCG
jgi:hypothetical protein